MVEKKHITVDLMLKHNGAFSIEDFYDEVEKWIRDKGMTKELKRKSEDIGKKGKKIEWYIEAWKSITDSAKEVVQLRVLFDNVTEIKIKRKDKVIKTNNSQTFIWINGWLEESLSGVWTGKPLFDFVRNLYDKYIWPVVGTHDGHVSDKCYDLHKRLKSFFEIQKIKLK